MIKYKHLLYITIFIAIACSKLNGLDDDNSCTNSSTNTTETLIKKPTFEEFSEFNQSNILFFISDQVEKIQKFLRQNNNLEFNYPIEQISLNLVKDNYSQYLDSNTIKISSSYQCTKKLKITVSTALENSLDDINQLFSKLIIEIIKCFESQKEYKYSIKTLLNIEEEDFDLNSLYYKAMYENHISYFLFGFYLGHLQMFNIKENETKNFIIKKYIDKISEQRSDDSQKEFNNLLELNNHELIQKIIEFGFSTSKTAETLKEIIPQFKEYINTNTKHLMPSFNKILFKNLSESQEPTILTSLSKNFKEFPKLNYFNFLEALYLYSKKIKSGFEMLEKLKSLRSQSTKIDDSDKTRSSTEPSTSLSKLLNSYCITYSYPQKETYTVDENGDFVINSDKTTSSTKISLLHKAKESTESLPYLYLKKGTMSYYGSYVDYSKLEVSEKEILVHFMSEILSNDKSIKILNFKSKSISNNFDKFKILNPIFSVEANKEYAIDSNEGVFLLGYEEVSEVIDSIVLYNEKIGSLTPKKIMCDAKYIHLLS